MYCCTKINDDIIWIGVNDRKTQRFENYIPLDNGVTYNSYLILDEKICIIDGVEEGENGAGSAADIASKVVRMATLGY